MAKRRAEVLCLVLVLFSFLTNGYYLDASCNDGHNKMRRSEIKRAMASVNELARSAVDTFQEIDSDPEARRGGSAKVRQEAFKNFFGNLVDRHGNMDLGKQGFEDAAVVLGWVLSQSEHDGVPGRPQPLPEPSSKDPDDPDLPVLRYGALDHRDVIIFCDTDRFDFWSEPGYSIDTTTGYKTRETEQQLRERSVMDIDRRGNVRESEAAWTYNPKLRRRRGSFRYPTTVQLNPQLRRIHRANNNIDKGLYNLRDWYPRQDRKNSFMATLDQILFHEMTHSDYDPDIVIGDDGGYYWDDCLASSRQYGWKNADNLTIFAFLAALSKDPGLKYGRSGIPRWIR